MCCYIRYNENTRKKLGKNLYKGCKVEKYFHRKSMLIFHTIQNVENGKQCNFYMNFPLGKERKKSR